MMRRKSLPFVVGVGAFVGLAWSSVPILLFDAARSPILFAVAGASTGILLTLFLATVRFPHLLYWLIGALTLPTGACIFGTIIGLFSLFEQSGLPRESPLREGIVLGFLSLVPPFVIVTLPMAIATTFFVVKICRNDESVSTTQVDR